MGQTLTSPAERTLRSFSLLQCVSDAELKTVEAKCRWRSFTRGETILDKGSGTRDVFFVMKGSVAVVTFSPAGREVTLATVKPGEFFGELAAIDGQPRSASVTAIEKTDLAMMPPEVFTELIRSRAEVSFQLLLRM